MIPYAAVRGLSPDFNNFLRAPIDEDRNGVLLSVLSALARMDIDPWQEAAQLSQLSRDKATQRLASLIAGLPDSASSCRNPVMIATRLIALLPRSVRAAVASQEELPESPTAIRSRNAALLIFFLFIVAAVIASLFIAGAQPSSARTELGHDTLPASGPATASPGKP